MSALRQVQIDEILVWNPRFVSQVLEIGDGICIDAQAHLFLEVLGVGIPDRIGEVIFFFHRNVPYCLRSFGSALRAEMTLISVSSCR